MPDSKARQIIQDKLAMKSGTEIQRLDRKNRDHFLRILKEEGLSLRQIERLTGVNRGVVQKA